MNSSEWGIELGWSLGKDVRKGPSVPSHLFSNCLAVGGLGRGGTGWLLGGFGVDGTAACV